MTEATANQKMTLTFNVIEATVTQELEIVASGVTEEGVIQGLNDGSYATTMAHDNEQKCIISLSDDSVIARILEQEVDGEYTEYKSLD